MREELEEKILKKYPWFRARNVWSDEELDFATPCSCGDGWYELIYGICKEIDELYKSKNADISKFRILQIKEKYGGLCFYCGSYIDGVNEIIYKYENMSEHVCEQCGKIGSIKHSGSWLRTLCKACGDDKGYIECEEI